MEKQSRCKDCWWYARKDECNSCAEYYYIEDPQTGEPIVKGDDLACDRFVPNNSPS